jgi:hypothetical protein
MTVYRCTNSFQCDIKSSRDFANCKLASVVTDRIFNSPVPLILSRLWWSSVLSLEVIDKSELYLFLHFVSVWLHIGLRQSLFAMAVAIGSGLVVEWSIATPKLCCAAWKPPLGRQENEKCTSAVLFSSTIR